LSISQNELSLTFANGLNKNCTALLGKKWEKERVEKRRLILKWKSDKMSDYNLIRRYNPYEYD
jgi:hypothetical protein